MGRRIARLGEAIMQPTVMAILERQGDLAAMARQCTDDVIEARYLVHKVLSRAFQKYQSPSADLVLSDALRRDMRALVAQAREGSHAIS
jgi:hypothetical protein